MKKFLLILAILLPLSAAGQEEIRTVAGDTVLRTVLRIDRPWFLSRGDKVHLKNTKKGKLPVKVPFSYLESIRFQDGCEVFFNEKGLQFERTLNPQRVKVNRGSGLLLEGVYEMGIPDIQLLFGEERCQVGLLPYRRLYNVGVISSFGGVLLCMPLVTREMAVLLAHAGGRHEEARSMDFIKGSVPMAIAGVVCIAGGVTLAVIGHKGCERFALSFTGTGLSMRF